MAEKQYFWKGWMWKLKLLYQFALFAITKYKSQKALSQIVALSESKWWIQWIIAFEFNKKGLTLEKKNQHPN